MSINTNLKKSQPVNTDSEDLQEEDLAVERKKTSVNFNKAVIGCGIGAAVLLVVLAIVYFTKGNDETSVDSVDVQDIAIESTETTSSSNSDKPWLNSPSGVIVTEESVVEEVVVERNNTEPDGTITPGITDVEADTVGKNFTDISSGTYTKDINGKSIDEHYVIDRIDTVIDFVSYTKKRGSSDTGIEVYWLDAEYKGKKAQIQVPFSIFKELDPVGVTVVDVEVVTIDDGTMSDDPPQVVTGFTVRSDYKRILEQNSK